MTTPCSKEQQINLIHETLEELKPLIPTLKRIVAAEEAKTWLSIRIASGIKITAAIGTALAAIFGILWAVYKELKR